jgi:hypothetical protein
LITRADTGTDHSRSDHADIDIRRDIEEFVEDVVATGNDNSSSMFQLRGNVRVEKPRLNLFGDKEEEHIGDGGGFGEIVLDREGRLSGRLGVRISKIGN